MGEVIVVTSGKGGVGKTTTTANLGAALAGSGRKTVIVDMDLGLRKLDIAIGIADRVVYNVVDVIKKRCALSDALIKDKRFGELYLLPASQSENKLAIDPDEMKVLCRELSQRFDFVLIDSPAGVERGFENSVSGADSAVVVVTADAASLRDADRIADILTEQYRIRNIRVLVNRYRPDLVRSGAMIGIESVISMLRIGVVGIVPEDDAVITAASKNMPVISIPESRAAKCFENTAKRIAGADVPLTRFKNDGVFKRIFKAIHQK